MVGNPVHALCQEVGLLRKAPRERAVPKRTSYHLRSDGVPTDRAAVDAVLRVLREAIDECEAGEASDAPSVGAHMHAAWESARPGLLATYADPNLLDAAWTTAQLHQCAVDGCAHLSEEGVQLSRPARSESTGPCQ